MVWLTKKERKSVNLSSRLYYARLIVASSDMNVTLTRACSFKNVKSLYKCKGGLSALYLSLLLYIGFDCMKKPCASSHCVGIFVVHFWHFQLVVLTESPVFDVFIAQVLFNDYLMIMIFQSRIGIRKKKKGQQISPPENVFIPYLFSPAHLHIFHFLFFRHFCCSPGS